MLVPEGFIFISTRTMAMRTYSGFRVSYRHFLKRNGFEVEKLNSHRFRHTPKIVQKLLAGTYAPKINKAQVRDQLRQLDPLLSENVEINVRYA